MSFSVLDQEPMGPPSPVLGVVLTAGLLGRVRSWFDVDPMERGLGTGLTSAPCGDGD